VGPAQGESAFTVAVKINGAEAGVLATVVPSTVSVTVAGEMPVLQTLAADEITATVDLSDLSPGTHRLAPVVELPAGLELVGVDPPQVVVTVSGP
jgi:YbbR domain-containing protein